MEYGASRPSGLDGSVESKEHGISTELGSKASRDFNTHMLLGIGPYIFHGLMVLGADAPRLEEGWLPQPAELGGYHEEDV